MYAVYQQTRRALGVVRIAGNTYVQDLRQWIVKSTLPISSYPVYTRFTIPLILDTYYKPSYKPPILQPVPHFPIVVSIPAPPPSLAISPMPLDLIPEEE